MSRFSERVVLVTGAGRGQGRAEVERFAAESAIVVGTDLVPEPSPVMPEIPIVAHDVRDSTSWDRVVSDVVARHGRIDVLVNNAGVLSYGAVQTMTEAEFRSVVDVNLIGPFLGIRACVPFMAPGSAIVNVASLSGIAGQGGAAAYSASKFGLRGLTRSAAIDLGPLGIRVNAVLPGVIRTPMISHVLDEHSERIASGLPLGRVGEPLDVAGAVTFLASDDAAWITGTDLVVDGGHTAGTPKL